VADPDLRCPACAALLRAGDTWCGQCLTDLRAPEERLAAAAVSADAPVAVPVARPASRGRHAKPADPVPLAQKLTALTGVTSSLVAPAPAPSLTHPDEIPEEEWRAALATAPLARGAVARPEVAADDDESAPTPAGAPGTGEESVDVMLSLLAASSGDGVGGWSAKLSSPGVKLAVVVGGGLALMAGLLVGLTVLGSLFG
jgi:hypothetical protein